MAGLVERIAAAGAGSVMRWATSTRKRDLACDRRWS